MDWGRLQLFSLSCGPQPQEMHSSPQSASQPMLAEVLSYLVYIYTRIHNSSHAVT